MNDTNLITVPLSVWNAMQGKAGMDGSQMVEVAKMILASVTPLMVAVGLWITSRSNRTLDRVHTEVNNKTTLMAAELKELRELLAASGIRNATLEEQKRGEEMAVAKAAIPAAAPAAPTGAFTDAQMSQLKEMMRGSKGPEPITAVLSGPIPMPVEIVKK